VGQLLVRVSPGFSARSREAFRSHYRDLVVGALLRSAEARLAEQRAARHRLRAWRAERAVEQLRPLLGPPTRDDDVSAPLFGPGLRAVATVAWLVAGGLLIVDLVVFGIHSWTTSVADAAVIALALLWFVVTMGSETRQAASQHATTVAADPEPVPEPTPQVFYFSEREVAAPAGRNGDVLVHRARGSDTARALPRVSARMTQRGSRLPTERK
jgi:hypothetical protein